MRSKKKYSEILFLKVNFGRFHPFGTIFDVLTDRDKVAFGIGSYSAVCEVKTTCKSVEKRPQITTRRNCNNVQRPCRLKATDNNK